MTIQMSKGKWKKSIYFFRIFFSIIQAIYSEWLTITFEELGTDLKNTDFYLKKNILF